MAATHGKTTLIKGVLIHHWESSSLLITFHNKDSHFTYSSKREDKNWMVYPTEAVVMLWIHKHTGVKCSYRSQTHMEQFQNWSAAEVLARQWVKKRLVMTREWGFPLTTSELPCYQFSMTDSKPLKINIYEGDGLYLLKNKHTLNRDCNEDISVKIAIYLTEK